MHPGLVAPPIVAVGGHRAGGVRDRDELVLAVVGIPRGSAPAVDERGHVAGPVVLVALGIAFRVDHLHFAVEVVVLIGRGLAARVGDALEVADFIVGIDGGKIGLVIGHGLGLEPVTGVVEVGDQLPRSGFIGSRLLAQVRAPPVVGKAHHRVVPGIGVRIRRRRPVGQDAADQAVEIVVLVPDGVVVGRWSGVAAPVGQARPVPGRIVGIGDRMPLGVGLREKPAAGGVGIGEALPLRFRFLRVVGVHHLDLIAVGVVIGLGHGGLDGAVAIGEGGNDRDRAPEAVVYGRHRMGSAAAQFPRLFGPVARRIVGVGNYGDSRDLRAVLPEGILRHLHPDQLIQRVVIHARDVAARIGDLDFVAHAVVDGDRFDVALIRELDFF